MAHNTMALRSVTVAADGATSILVVNGPGLIPFPRLMGLCCLGQVRVGWLGGLKGGLCGVYRANSACLGLILGSAPAGSLTYFILPRLSQLRHRDYF